MAPSIFPDSSTATLPRYHKLHIPFFHISASLKMRNTLPFLFLMVYSYTFSRAHLKRHLCEDFPNSQSLSISQHYHSDLQLFPLAVL